MEVRHANKEPRQRRSYGACDRTPVISVITESQSVTDHMESRDRITY